MVSWMASSKEALRPLKCRADITTVMGFAGADTGARVIGRESENSPGCPDAGGAGEATRDESGGAGAGAGCDT